MQDDDILEDICDRFVYHYLFKLPTYSQVVPSSACTGAHAYMRGSQSDMKLVLNLRGIVLNEAQSPARSFDSMLPNPFHRPHLQIIYFCIKQGRSLLGRSETMNADQRLTIAQTVEAILSFVIEAIQSHFRVSKKQSRCRS